MLDDTILAINALRLEKRSESRHFGAMGRRQKKSPLHALPIDRSDLHQFTPASDSGDRKPVRHALAKGRQIRLDSEENLRTRQVPAKPSDHLVEDEYRAAGGAQTLDLVKKVLARARTRRTADSRPVARAVAIQWARRQGRCRLEHDRGNLSRMQVEQ